MRGIISEKNLLNRIQNIGNVNETSIFIEMSEKNFKFNR